MISAEDLYRKIKAKYPDWEPPRAESRDYSVPDRPPLSQQDLELIEAGFPITPAFDPRHYPDSHFSDEFLDEIIARTNRKTQHA